MVTGIPVCILSCSSDAFAALPQSTAIAARPLSEAQAGRIIEGTDKLDQCDDIAALAALVGCEQGQHIERVSTSVDLF